MPHGACYLWLPSVLWLHIVSDTIIALAYFSIPFALLYFVHKRTDLVYRWVFVLFGIFILLCGTTHLMSIWTIWFPDYWLEGLIKFATALVSIVTALLVWPLIPKLLQLPSPEALKTSETYLRAIFNATPDAMLISNDQGIITMVNQQAECLLGYKAHELVGQSIDILVPERFRSNHPKLRAQFASSPCSQTTEMSRVLLALKKDNSEFDVDISLSPIKTEQGQFFASALRDVTFRKQAEAALLESEDRFRRMANNSPVMIWITDENGNPSFANQSWRDFTGIYSAHIAYQEWIQTVHPDDRDTAFAGYYQNTQSRDPITSEYRLRSVDGTWNWILDKGIPIFNENGVFSGYMGSAIDITERKQAEANLRVAATAFETQESMVITDANQVILQINRAFTESTGYTAAESIGQKMNLIKSGRHDDAFYVAMWESINSTGSWQGEIWDRRKNGELYLQWLTITAVKGNDGVVSHYVGTHVDITERKLAEEEIKHLAFYDPLTHLPNRRLLKERLKHCIEVERREGKKLALLMLDLDRFKSVNDSLGHLAGDELLQQVAERITSRLRDVDTVARLGGDEFIMLLEDINHPQDAARVAEEIVADLNKPFKLSQSDEVWISASIGISLYPEHGGQFELLMDHADAALYQAKDQGRGCFAYFSEDLTHSVRQRIALESRLRRAIEQQELRLYYQPQIDILSGNIVGAEALVRWQDPIEGLISPSLFIPIAEETHLIVAIGEWVLRETCNQGRQWLESGIPPLTLGVNVSPHQFRRSDINALVATVLAETHFPAEYLELEITETGLMENQENATNILNSLHDQGIRLAIDDFGTGYSSLAYLKRFPLDVLKIDKRFIDEIPHNKDDMEIAATIVAMGHALGLKVLAEGVETPEQLSFLQAKSCDSYQGFIKSRPLPAEEFAQFLRDQLRDR
ncbi:MAG: EAL domain-containing protein [Methylococcaceae bacterium]|nr:EAL domain-containing protein [Methylococcaceae bacterium]